MIKKKTWLASCPRLLDISWLIPLLYTLYAISIKFLFDSEENKTDKMENSFVNIRINSEEDSKFKTIRSQKLRKNLIKEKLHRILLLNDNEDGFVWRELSCHCRKVSNSAKSASILSENPEWMLRITRIGGKQEKTGWEGNDGRDKSERSRRIAKAARKAKENVGGRNFRFDSVHVLGTFFFQRIARALTRSRKVRIANHLRWARRVGFWSTGNEVRH